MTDTQIRVLHVDDEPEFTDLTAAFLERHSDRFSVEAATSANEGLTCIRDTPPDCVVSDYNMPGMNGIEFLTAVREEFPDLPFVLFTGKGSETVASDAISAGVTDYLRKKSGSERYELLANRITNAVEGRRATQQADRQQDLMSRVEVLGNMGGWELNLDTETLRMTSGLKRLYGLDEDQGLSLAEVTDLYDEASQKSIDRIIADATETGYAESTELCFQRVDGEQRIAKGNAEIVENNENETILRGAVRDITDEHERRQDLKRIETLFQHAQDSLFLINVGTEFTIERVNPAWENATGLPADAVRGRRPREVLGDKQGRNVEQQYQKCIKRQEPIEYEEQLRFGEQQRYWETQIAPVTINGDVEYIAGSTRDVTDGRKRQRELRVLQKSIDNADMGITLTDPSQDDNPLVYANDAYGKLTGYSSEETIGRNCRYLQTEDTDIQKTSALREAIDAEEPITVELRNCRKDGTEFWNRLTITPIYDDSGSLIRYLGSQQDVTERKERERELARTQALLSDMEQLADVGAWEYDPEAETLTITDGTRHLYGLDAETNLTLTEALEAVHPDDRDRLADQFNACIETGESYEDSARLVTPSGERRWISFRGERVDTREEGHVVRGYIRDITGEKTREQRLTQLTRATKTLLTAETGQQVAEIGVEAANDVLGLQANAIHFLKDGDTQLVPVAQTDKVASLAGGTTALPVADSIAGRAYQNGEPEILEDVRRDPDVYDADTDLRSYLYLPIADHGVLIAGAEERSEFDTQDIEFGELLAGNLAAALDRIEHEQTAHEQQQQLSLFFDESPLGAVQWDEKFRFERLNQQAEEILGYTEADLRGEGWEAIVADDDHGQVGAVVESLLAADGGIHTCNKNVRQNGEVVTCEWHNRVVTDDDGTVQAVFSKFQDISEQEEMRRDLKQERDLLRGILETSPVGIVVLDANGEVLFVNDQAEAIYGQSKKPGSELPHGDSQVEFLTEHGDPIENGADPFNRVIAQKTTICDYVAGIRRPSGDGLWVSINGTPQFNEEGDVERAVFTLKDITDRRRTEAKSKETLDRISDGFYALDDEFQFTHVNTRAEELLEASREGLLGESVWEMYPEAAETDTVWDAFHTAMDTQAPQEFELHYQSLDSWFEVLVYPSESGLSVYFRDVTAIKSRERELESQNDRLEEFTSIVSHDLQSPLAVAEGHLELAQETCESAHLTTAANAVERSQALIEDLLTLARNGEHVAETEPVAVENLAEKCWQTIETRQATLEINIERVIKADPSRFRQLLENLCRNAVEHGGNDVTVRIGEVEDGIYVADTGHGIPEADREDVFEAGYSTSEHGTGFGLRIAEQVANAHGWDITATDGDQTGARFEIIGVENASRDD